MRKLLQSRRRKERHAAIEWFRAQAAAWTVVMRTFGKSLTPDGPTGRFHFHFQRRLLDLSRSPLRYRLLIALWDSDRHRPVRDRETTDVMDELWPDDDKADNKFRNLIFETNGALARAAIPLKIRTLSGRVWLDIRPI